MQVSNVRLDSLKEDPNNVNKHDGRSIEAITASLKRFGQVEPLVVHKGIVCGGNGRLAAMKNLGWKECSVHEFKGTAKEATALAIALNRTAQFSEFDDDALKMQLLSLDGIDLADVGFNDSELAELLKDEEPPEVEDVEPQIDRADELAKEWKTEQGQLWLIEGEKQTHRLLCGDSTNDDNVRVLMVDKKASLVFTDPPYGMSYKSNHRTATKKFAELDGDDVILDGWIEPAIKRSEGWVFVWSTWKVMERWQSTLKEFGDLTNLIVWHKPGGSMGDLDKTFCSDHEIAFVFNRGARRRGKRIGSVWTFNKDAAASYQHPTQKPIELFAEGISKTTDSGQIVYDPFLGSGTTMLAAEQLDRKCYGMEISSRYTAVILQRMSDAGCKCALDG